MRKICGLVLIVLLASLLAACGSKADKTAREGGTINEENQKAIQQAQVTTTPLAPETQVAVEATAATVGEATMSSPVAAEATPASVVSAASPVAMASPAASPVTATAEASPASTP